MSLCDNWLKKVFSKKEILSRYGADFGTEYCFLGIKFFKKNFDLHSGERQTGCSLAEIRQDHRNRYQLVVDYVGKSGRKPEKILDCFCGNGYGSFMMGQAFPETEILGIDGSEGAIEAARTCFNCGKNTFRRQCYPFSLGRTFYDVIVCLESIEHIRQDENFLKTLAARLKKDGLFFLSTPNSEVYPLAPTENRFHFRHYTRKEVEKLAGKCGLRILECYSQNVYQLDEQKNTIGLLPENEMVLKKDFAGQFDIFILAHSTAENETSS